MKSNKIIIPIVILVAFITILVVVIGSADSPRKRLAHQLDLGAKYLSEEKYEQAIAAFDVAISINPKCAEAYLGKAEAYVALGDYQSAIDVLKDGYEQTLDESIKNKIDEIDNSERLEESSNNIFDDDVSEEAVEEEIEQLKQAKKGDIVTFGRYEQDNDLQNGIESIEWYVLENNGDEITLLSVYILDAKPFNETNPMEGYVQWEDCSLRKWLNNEFCNVAFTSLEQQYLVETLVPNNGNYMDPWIPIGNDTVDKVYLLSLEEIEQYLGIITNYSDPLRMENYAYQGAHDYPKNCYETNNMVVAKNTEYARANGIFDSDGEYWRSVDYMSMEWQVEYEDYAIGAGNWWLRDAAESDIDEGAHAETVSAIGYVGDCGRLGRGIVEDKTNGVRPVIKVAINN